MEEQNVIGEIVKELGRLPLAINIAGAYIARRQISFAKYLERYRQTAARLLEEIDDLDEYRKSVATAFTLAYVELCKTEDETDEAKLTAKAVEILLRSLVFLSPEVIPEKLFLEILSVQDENFARITEDEDSWEQIRVKLTQYDLLEYNVERNTFETHRLVQEVIKTKLASEEKKILLEKIILVLSKLFPKHEIVTWKEYEKYLPHAQTVIRFTQDLQLENEEVAFLCNQVGFYLDNIAQYQQSEFLYQRALEISEKVFGNEHSNTSTILNNLALSYCLQGKYKEALPLYERALEISEEVLGEHPDTATKLSNLATLYRKLEMYEEALLRFERALEIREKVLGEEHPMTVLSRTILAFLCHSQGKYEKSLPLFERNFAIQERKLGAEHSNTATRLNDLAEWYKSQGIYEEALPLYERALAIYRKVLGKDHPHTQLIAENLSSCREAMNGR